MAVKSGHPSTRPQCPVKVVQDASAATVCRIGELQCPERRDNFKKKIVIILVIFIYKRPHAVSVIKFCSYTHKIHC